MVDNWPISYDDAHDPKYGEPFTVPLRIASKETLQKFGKHFKCQINKWPFLYLKLLTSPICRAMLYCRFIYLVLKQRGCTLGIPVQ